MKTAKFLLKTGTKKGQQNKEQKLKQGEEYVKTLKKDEKVIDVEYTDDAIIITME